MKKNIILLILGLTLTTGLLVGCTAYPGSQAIYRMANTVSRTVENNKNTNTRNGYGNNGSATIDNSCDACTGGECDGVNCTAGECDGRNGTCPNGDCDGRNGTCPNGDCDGTSCTAGDCDGVETNGQGGRGRGNGTGECRMYEANPENA